MCEISISGSSQCVCDRHVTDRCPVTRRAHSSAVGFTDISCPTLLYSSGAVSLHGTMSRHLGRHVCVCVLRVSDVTLGQLAKPPCYPSPYRFASCLLLLLCLLLLFDCYQTSVLFQRVCVHVICQCLSQTKNTFCVKADTRTNSHRTSSPVLLFFARRSKCVCLHI